MDRDRLERAQAVPQFDLGGVFAAIETERTRRGVSMAAVSREIGVSASTLRRFGTADDAEADGVLAALAWLEIAPETFVEDSCVKPAPLPRTDGGFVRVDMDSVAAAIDEPGGAKGRTRTTIQRLVQVAQTSGCNVRSLTRVAAT